MKFKIEVDKLQKGDLQLGAFLNREVQYVENISTGLCTKKVQRYLYVCLFKITISIGFMW